MDEGSVTFKGTVNGLTIIMKEEVDFNLILQQIERKIVSAGKFFRGAILNVKYRGKKLTPEEVEKIFQLMSIKSGAKIIKGIEEDKDEVPRVQNTTNVQSHLYKTKMKNSYFTGIEEGVSRFYRGTVRSGQLLSFNGNIIVIGDVNPGGEVVAGGNVIIMGSLRGIVHAGADGNKDAIVVAFNLQPTQLRIADVITRSPDEKGFRNQLVPEYAFVKGDMVYIERYLPQR